MDERAGWLPERAREAQGWVQDRTQSLPRPAWMQAQPTQPTFVAQQAAPGVSTAPVPNPMAGGMGAPPAPDAPDARPRRRWLRRGLFAGGIIAVFALGSCAGSMTSMDTVSTLEGEVETLTGQVAGATAENDELEELVAQQVADLEGAEEEAAEVASTLATAETDLETSNADLAAAQTTIAERDATIAALQAELAAQSSPAPAPAAAAAAPAAATPATAAPAAAAPAAAAPAPYYANCAAARAAGAAPVVAGQPGYGRHLDRDGDGVGCE